MAFKDMTLGQYYPAESVMHSLDPRTKIVGTLAFIVSLFCVKDFWGFGLAIVCLGVCIGLSKVPFKFMARGLKAIIFLMAVTMIVNLFSTPGEVLISFWKLSITKEGIYNACFMGLRLMLLIFGSSLLTLTTKPLELTDGLELLFKPLSKIGLPSHELAMMMSIALRFIPTLLEETDKIMKAQTARGADFESGKLTQRAKALVPLLVPLFVSAFRIASDLAMAMEARCYRGGQGRTRMNQMKFKLIDLIFVLVLALYFAAIIIV